MHFLMDFVRYYMGNNGAICLYLGRYGDILEYGGQYCPEIVRYSKGFMVWNIPYLIQLCYFRGIMGRYGPEIVKSCQDS